MKLTDAHEKYRHDIDGLRAIAVLSVIIFHINGSLLPGGFIGVDIFFVISGYLISLHIFKDLDKHRFSIVEFYRRRIKRIAPAMLVVVFVTIVVTQFLFRPGDAEKVAESGLWSLLSLANVYFWLKEDTSYFAPASDEFPLLHLWSLGVEEQFYLFWPLILFVAHRIGHGKHFFVSFMLSAIVSFILGQYLFDSAPSFTYYMLPTRAGELLVGALVAHVIFKHGNIALPRRLLTIASWVGLLLIAGSLVFLSENMVFPGLWAVPPTLGAGLLIFAGNYSNNGPAFLLTMRPMVWIGLISYSAYLWHWPILALFRYSHTEINLLLGAALFAATLLIAWGSYRYIETPMRRSTQTAWGVFSRQYAVPCLVIGVVALASMKLDGYGLRWLSNDYRAKLTQLRNETKPAYKYDYVCQRQLATYDDANNVHCVIGDNNASMPKAILWGDSNAAHYVGMVGVFAREAGFKFRNLQVGSCPPLSTELNEFVSTRRASDCRKSQQVILPTIDKYPVVIISASWSSYQSLSQNFLAAFFNTVQALSRKGKLVILIGKAPVINTYDRLCREKAISLPFINCDTSSVPLSQEVSEINEKLKHFSENTQGVEYYEITKHLCHNGACSAFNSHNKPIYYDASHLTLGASWDIGNTIYKQEGVPFPFTLISNWPNNEVSMLEQADGQHVQNN